MKARTKITFWTASFSLLVAIVFSGFVFNEAMEQSLRMIDRELLDVRDLTLKHINSISPLSSKAKVLAEQPFNRYLIKVTGGQDRILLKTILTEHLEFPLRTNGKFYFERKEIAMEKLWVAEEDKYELQEITGDTVIFRVLQERWEMNDIAYELLIAKPIPILVQEVKELVFDFIYWSLLCTILIVLMSYYLAGRILRPLSRINVLIKEINDASLHKRLPVGKSVDELHTLSSSLNNMFDRLQNSFDRQKEYISNASHELNSPLTILMVGNEKLLSEPLPENARRTIERQLDTLRGHSKLVRNLLEISRLERSESLNRELIDLKPLLVHVTEEFEDLLLEQKIQLSSDLETTSFLGDRQKILQMLINLLDNAIKYNSSSNGKIWLETKAVDDSVELTISNTGETIPKDSLEKIFDQFYRVEKSRSALFGGAGLGLTIVKQIVGLHYGTITVTSNAEGVTTFLIRFPSKIQ